MSFTSFRTFAITVQTPQATVPHNKTKKERKEREREVFTDQNSYNNHVKIYFGNDSIAMLGAGGYSKKWEWTGRGGDGRGPKLLIDDEAG